MARREHSEPAASGALTAAEFAALDRRIRSEVPWGGADRRGALNNITAATTLAAIREVRSGRTVSLSAAVENWPTADNPQPCGHDMTGSVADHTAAAGLDFATDRFVMNVHGNADSHIDALCHVIYDAELYNDVAADTLTPTGATSLTIEVAKDGIVGRGVLLDIPSLRGTRWLEPGDHVTAADLAAAEDAERLRVGPGDLVFVRVGHRRRRRELGPWDAAESRSGLHPTAVEFLAERRAGVLGSDGNNDTAPSTTEGVAFPVHVLAINALGMHLLDYLQFEDLAALCDQERHWSFFCVIAPLRLPSATGSPVNPIAVL